MTRYSSTRSVCRNGRVTGSEITKAAVPKIVPPNPKGLSARTSATIASGDGEDGFPSCPLAKATELKKERIRKATNKRVTIFVTVSPSSGYIFSRSCNVGI